VHGPAIDTSRQVCSCMQVNKGPHSAAMVAEARRLGASAVRGNHDDAGLAAYLDHRAGRPVKVYASQCMLQCLPCQLLKAGIVIMPCL
jgi:hypothetical protein